MNEEAGQNMETKCPQCGAPLPSGGLAGLCPACLLKQATAETATQPEAQAFQPPSVEELARLFPQLEIISLIGKGGMGAVYMARQPVLDRIVALKILPSRIVGGADFAERFNREARALAKLNHPNIVTVHEFGQVNGMPFFIMEYVDGLNLRQLEHAGKLSPREALQIVPQICEALQFAHDAGIVHRDIKPDNILVDKKGRVKIADFGIAKILGAAPDTTVPETQGAIGTPHYMAPEQVERPQSVDHRADIFSLGVVFYEMLTGELPLGKFGPPSTGPRGMVVDVRLDEVVLRALEKEPDRRYQHASQVKSAVETIAATSAGGAPPTPSGPGPAVILARDYDLDIGRCVSRGWELVKANFWPLVGMHALIALLLVIADSVFARISSIGSDVGGVHVEDGTSILGLVLAGPLWAGLFAYFLKTMRGEPVTVETAFSGFNKRFLHLFLVNLVAWFLIGLGFVLLVIPGIYLLVAWCFCLVLVMDKGLEFWPAMELSRQVVNKHWWKIFGFLLVLAGVWLAGLAFCCIGVLVSAPVALAVFLYAYEDIFGARTPTFGRPVPPPPVAGVGAAKPAGLASPAGPANPPVPPPAAPPGASGANPPSGQPGPAGAFGPGGTMVMPVAAASPPRGVGSRWLKFALLAIAGLLILMLTVFLAFIWIKHHTHLNYRSYSYSTSYSPPYQAPQPLQPILPPAAPAPMSPMAPLAPGQVEIISPDAYYGMVDRIRQEFDKAGIHFNQLQLTSTNDSTLVVTFSGLKASRLVNGTNTWQDITGSLVGTRTTGRKWLFEGREDLSSVHFDIAGMNLPRLLAAYGTGTANPTAVPASPASNENSHENLLLRLEAAETITDPDVKDAALSSLSTEAARSGNPDIVSSALGDMIEIDQRDTATASAALLLGQNGHRREAIEIAKGISDVDTRDQTLAKLAE